MKRIIVTLPILAGAIAGAIVALAIGAGNSTKTVTETIVSGGASTAAAAVPTSSTSSAGALTVNQIYKQDSAGVVDILVTSDTTTSGSSGNTGAGGLFGLGGSSQTEEQEDEGAGVVFDTRGDIITDEHVVAGSDPKIEVRFQDGVSAPATIVGKPDASTDVAVIHVNVAKSQLHPIPFANSSTAQVGDPVVAIGVANRRRRELETVVGMMVNTVVVRSDLGGRPTFRELLARTKSGMLEVHEHQDMPFELLVAQLRPERGLDRNPLYQVMFAFHDAAINPGNSGGPLLDSTGQVLGLNDQIQTSSGDSAGVGFATPGNTDVQVAKEMIAGKQVEHAYVGLCVQDANTGAGAEIAPSSEASASGSGCSTPVVSGGPAAKAGLKAGEVITAVDGQQITSSDDFVEVLGKYAPGDVVTFTVKDGGTTKTIKVTLGNRPATVPSGG